MNFKVVSESFAVRLTAVLVLTVVSGTVLSTLFFYAFADRSLGTTYAERIVNLDVFKWEVVRNSLYIYALFSAAMLVVVLVFSVYYSHKVTGPLVRLRIFARDMEGGRFGGKVRFRSGDVIHPLAEAAEVFSMKHGALQDELGRLAGEMEAMGAELMEALEKGEAERADILYGGIQARARELDRLAYGIKV